MKKTTKIIIIVTCSLLVIAVLIGIPAFLIYHFFLDTQSLPTGEYITESVSPDGKYTVKAYLSTAALSSDSVRCEVVNNETKKRHNIYWQYMEGSAEIYWTDNRHVNINGIELDVEYDIYDWRHHNSSKEEVLT